MSHATINLERFQVQPSDDTFTVECAFRFLGVDVRVRSANIGLVQHWAAMHSPFRAPPGPAAITVQVHGPTEGPPAPGQVTIESNGIRRIWRGSEAVMPPLATPPLDRWIYFQGMAVGRAGQAVLVVGRAGTGRTLLAMSVVGLGAWLLADGIVPVDPGDLLIAPFPTAIRFRRPVLSQLAIDEAHPALTPFRTRAGTVEWRADPRALLGSRSARVPAGAGAIVFVDPTERAGEPRLRPLGQQEALVRLLNHLHQPPADPEATRKALAKLCRQTPAHVLTAGPAAATARLIHDTLLT